MNMGVRDKSLHSVGNCKEEGNADLEERMKEKKVVFHKGVQIRVS